MLECTDSNEPNQKGSRFGGLSQAGAMMSDKGYSLGNEADQKAFAKARNYPSAMSELEKRCWTHRIDGSLVDGQLHFDHRKFAELFLNESIEVMKQHDYHGEWLGDKLKEYWGMRHED